MPAPVHASWFSRRSRGSFNRHPNATTSQPLTPPAAIRHPFSAQSLNDTTLQAHGWLRQTDRARLSNVDTMSTQEGVIQFAERGKIPARTQAVIISSTDIQKIQPRSDISQYPNTNRSTQNSMTQARRSSILMHPWHDNPKSDGATTLRNGYLAPVANTFKPQTNSARTSFIYEGYAWPVPPTSSASPGHLRHYSSSTLKSPILSPEEDESNQGPVVRLLTFESNFRMSEDSHSVAASTSTS